MGKIVPKVSQKHAPFVSVALFLLIGYLGFANLALGMEWRDMAYTIFGITAFAAFYKKYIH